MEGGSPVDHLPLQQFGKKLVNIHGLSRGPGPCRQEHFWGAWTVGRQLPCLVPSYHGSEGA